MTTDEKKDSVPKPPVKKKSSKPPAAKGAAASKSKGKRTKKISKSALQQRQKTAAPLILVIMVLLTVIIFLLIRPSDKTHLITEKKPVKNKQVVTETREKPKPDIKEKPAADTKDKPEKTEKPAVIEETTFNVRLWFLRFDEKTEKVRLVSVKRKVVGDNRVEAALKKLLEGPTADENNQDYLTALPKNLKLRNVEVRDRIAEVDFSDVLGTGAAGTILMNRLDQIVYTATQFDDIDGVSILINGKKQNMLGSDGLSIQGVLRRK